MKDKSAKYKIERFGLLDKYFDRVMAIGPHSDDIELGCFGTMVRLKSKGSKVAFCVLSAGEVGGNPEQRKKETIESAKKVGAKLYFGNLPDTKISEGHPSIGFIELCIEDFKPTTIFINSPNDSHQDHRNAANAAISAARFVPIVLFYQTPSSTRRFNSELYIDITEHIKEKIEAVKIHKSQGKNVYMAYKAVRGLAEFLGFQIYRGRRLYEGFEIYQMII